MTDQASLNPHDTTLQREAEIEVIIDAVVAAQRAGDPADMDAIIRQYPSHESDLRRLLPVVLALEMAPADAGRSGPPSVPSGGDLSPQGRQLGDFRLIREVGRGGMGVVYEAEQLSLERRVALKVLPMAGILDDRQLTRFKNEARAAATLIHPHIVPVHAVGSASGTHFYAMQFIDGQSLAEVIATLRQEADLDFATEQHAGTQTRRVAIGVAPSHAGEETAWLSPQELPQKPAVAKQAASDTVPIAAAVTAFSHDSGTGYRSAAGLAADVAEALEYAHSMGVVHRDIKPGNLLLDRQGKIWVADFGLAQLETDAGLTMTGDVLGTLRYMSPEQAGGHSGLTDPRSDVYSLGLTLYELLTLRPAFPAKERGKLFQQISSEDPPRLRQVDPSAPRDLETIVLKAIAKSPQDRYRTAGEFAADLRRFLDDKPIYAKPPGVLEIFNKWRRRNHAAVATALTTLVLAIALAGTLLLRERSTTFAALASEQVQRTVATAEQRKALDAKALAEQQRDAAMLSQYHAEIVSGQTDWQRGYLQRLSRKLSGHLPVAGQRDLRGWEWYYLVSLCRPEVQTLHFPGSSLFVAWSPEGKYIGASGSIWRAETGENVHRLKPSDIKRYRCAWSPDGQRFAWGTASDDNCVYVWDRQTDALRELRGHRSSVWCVDWSPDGKQLASGGIDKEVWIWDAATGVKIKALDAGNYVTDVAWSPAGDLLAVGIYWDDLKVWEIETGELVSHCTDLAGPGDQYLVQLSWHPDGEQLALSTPRRWSLLRRSDWAIIRQQEMALARGKDIAWRPDGQRFAVADGETISIWQPEGDVPERLLRGHLTPVSAVAWSPDGQQLVSSGNTGEVKIWDLNSPVQPPTISTGGPVQSVSWAPDNVTLLTTSTSDGSTSFWETQSGRPLKSQAALADGQALWSPDRRLVAYRSDAEASEIRILNATTGGFHAVLRGDAEDRVFELAWSADSTKLASRKKSGKRTSIEMWDVDHEKLISRWNYRNTSLHSGLRSKLAWSPDDVHLAISLIGEDGDDGNPFWHGHIYVLDVASGTTVLKHNLGGWNHASDIASVAWKPDGEGLVAGSRDGLIEAIAVPSGRSLFSTRLLSTPVNSLAWSPDGERIACGAEDGSIKVLSGQSGDDLVTFALDEGASHVAWSPDAKRLAAATSGGNVRLWDASRGYEFSKQGRRRGELAQMYDETSRQGDAEMKHARLQEVLEVAPDTLDFWELRGHASATLGNFDRATAEFAKAIQPGLRRSFNAARYYGKALLAAGNQEAYVRHCVALLNELADTRVPSNGGHVAWACALVQDKRIDSEIVLRLAQPDADAKGGNEQMRCRGAALYRSGRYEDAASVLTDLARKLQSSGDPTASGDTACTLYFLAMARHQLGHSFQARRHLQDAVQIAAEIPPDSDWTVKVESDVLDREARALIGLQQ